MAALQLLRINGTLSRTSGGYWTPTGDPPDFHVHPRPGIGWVGTRTALSLVHLGLAHDARQPANRAYCNRIRVNTGKVVAMQLAGLLP